MSRLMNKVERDAFRDAVSAMEVALEDAAIAVSSAMVASLRLRAADLEESSSLRRALDRIDELDHALNQLL